MDGPCDECYKWGHKRDRVALMLGTWGTLLTQTGEIMRMAGSSLKEEAVTDEDVVVQRLKLTIRPEGLRDQTYFTVFILSNFWWPWCLSLQSWRVLCSTTTQLVVKRVHRGHSASVWVWYEMWSHLWSDMNSLSGPFLSLWPHLHVGGPLRWALNIKGKY